MVIFSLYRVNKDSLDNVSIDSQGILEKRYSDIIIEETHSDYDFSDVLTDYGYSPDVEHYIADVNYNEQDILDRGLLFKDSSVRIDIVIPIDNKYISTINPPLIDYKVKVIPVDNIDHIVFERESAENSNNEKIYLFDKSELFPYLNKFPQLRKLVSKFKENENMFVKIQYIPFE
jgi:hypothetical protein